MSETVTRAGTVALVGLPNAGKSSLLNRLLGSKLSIVTPFAQTTRERVIGIDTRGDYQMVFVDTPGIVVPAYLLHRSLVEIVEETLADADVVVLVTDSTRPPPELPAAAVEALSRAAGRLLVAVNKSDLAAETQLSAHNAWAESTFGAPAVTVSAETGEGLEELRDRIGEQLPESPFLYPEEDLSSQPVRFFVAEFIRETVFEQYAEEIPYSVAVRIEEFREDASPIVIRATIYVERPSQKGILIGKRGAALRELGTRARMKIEDFVGAHVFLELWVKVLPKWRKNPLELRRLGFPIPQETD
jgi:GTP-binding protein Era